VANIADFIGFFELVGNGVAGLRVNVCTSPKILPHAPVFRTLRAMDIQLTPDQKAFVRRAIESGRLHSEQDAVQEALALWEERERQRAEFLLTLDDARASLARGEGRVITQESMQQLASEVKERGRARLLAELTTSR
jgi:Arc/MetJ-type ribon-helix-helix transcriptional regulator